MPLSPRLELATSIQHDFPIRGSLALAKAAWHKDGYFFENAKVLPGMLQLFNFLSLFAFSTYTCSCIKSFFSLSLVLSSKSLSRSFLCDVTTRQIEDSRIVMKDWCHFNDFRPLTYLFNGNLFSLGIPSVRCASRIAFKTRSLFPRSSNGAYFNLPRLCEHSGVVKILHKTGLQED